MKKEERCILADENCLLIALDIEVISTIWLGTSNWP